MWCPGCFAAPMMEQDGANFSQRWGYLSRAGLNDKSQFTRQIEKYADIYTSRVSNFLRYTVCLTPKDSPTLFPCMCLASL
jgi:hypothetical protein